MGPPGWGDLESSSKAGPYYFWEQYIWTPPYGFSAMWCHTTSDCVTVCLDSLDVATSRGCQVESCHVWEPHRLPMCLDSLDTTVEGHYQVEAHYLWVPHGHSIWVLPHVDGLKNL